MEKRKLFGLPLNVGTDDEVRDELDDGDGPKYYMVMRVEDCNQALLPPALRRRNLRTPCEECGSLCVYDPLTMPASASIRIVCTQCLLALQKRLGTPQLLATRRQVNEIERELNADLPDWLRRPQ